mmetsp:Transcript_5454/g.17546  ORF Transcript_5454/g.17546 Transcript_5454/m.17546 type:complete len:292 (-) Transcript_5454:44-919(-)
MTPRFVPLLSGALVAASLIIGRRRAQAARPRAEEGKRLQVALSRVLREHLSRRRRHKGARCAHPRGERHVRLLDRSVQLWRTRLERPLARARGVGALCCGEARGVEAARASVVRRVGEQLGAVRMRNLVQLQRDGGRVGADAHRAEEEHDAQRGAGHALGGRAAPVARGGGRKRPRDGACAVQLQQLPLHGPLQLDDEPLDRLARVCRAHAPLPPLARLLPRRLQRLRLDGSLERKELGAECLGGDNCQDLADPLLAARAPRLFDARPRKAHLEFGEARLGRLDRRCHAVG